ncbi:hypothetical protein IKG49_04010 [Candidatus Saccharibacteria bacterium]|nr:hypothetical protein [Candidatus Saccharibacteria bacterium]
MNKLISLLKALMSSGVQLFNYRGKTERSRRVMPFVLGVFMGILMLLSGNATMAELKETGAETTILSIYTMITTLIIVMEGSYKAIDLLFKPRDNDTLLAMPIKKSTIIFARMIKFYLFEMIYCLIFLLPAVVAYATNVDVGMSFYLVAVTMLILIPVIPMAVACLIGLVIAAASGRFKHKTFLQVVFSFVVMFASIGLVFLLDSSPDIDGGGMVAFSNKITEYYYPASTFIDLVTKFDVLKYLIFIAINLVVLALTVFIVSRYCFRIISRLNIAKRTESIKAKYSFVRHSQTSAMVRKEITRYFNTPVLLMNTAMGLVFFAIATGVLCFNFDDMANSLLSSTDKFPLTVEQMKSFLPGMTFAMVAFASLLTCITATMISLEGGAINILKSLPISGIKVIMTKVLTAMILIVPVTALGSLVMAIRFQFGVLETILVLVGVILFPLVTELIGILINLRYPRFDADNDTVVVRQSASVMTATFLGLGMVLLTVSLIFTTIFLAGQIAGLLIINAVYLIIALFLYFAIAMRGEEKFLKLTA